MTTTTSVHLDVMTDGLTVGHVQTFLRGAAVLGAQPADPVERVLEELDSAERVVGLCVRGGAAIGTASATVTIDRRRMLELLDTLNVVIDSDGDARSVLTELTHHRGDLQDVLLGR